MNSLVISPTSTTSSTRISRRPRLTKGLAKLLTSLTGERISLNQLLEELKDLTGKGDVIADYQEPRAGDVVHSLADISRARELLGSNLG